MRQIRRAALLALAALTLVGVAAAAAAAQTISGTVVEAGSAAPIPGAFVILLDAQGVRQGAVLADAEGRFQLRVSLPGRYSLLAERIGYEDAVSPVLELRAGEAVVHRFEAQARAIRIEAIDVAAGARCQVQADPGAATHRLWEESRKALSIVAWAEQELVFLYQTMVSERVREVGTLALLDAAGSGRRLSSGAGGPPFYSAAARDLTEHGFVRRQDDGSFQYFGLDAAALLSDDFLQTHCFLLRAAPAGAPELIGLGFQPVPGRSTPDITGVLWLERATLELRFLEFTYTRHLTGSGVPLDPFGGRVEFRRLAGGAWITDRWWLRMPHFRGRELAVREEEREIRFLLDPTARTAGGSAGIDGLVYDSVRATPLAGATVFLPGTGHAAMTDSSGRFSLNGLPPGRADVTFFHPNTDQLGVSVEPRQVLLSAGRRVALDLAVTPDLGCTAHEPEPPTAGVYGFVSDRETGRPAAGAAVRVQWQIPRPDRSVWDALLFVNRYTDVSSTVDADANGRFLVCGLPLDTELRLNAGNGPTTSFVRPRPGLIKRDVIFR